jgi:NAD kinase
MDFEKIVLVTRQTRLEGLIERFNTRAQARFYIEHSGGGFDFYEHEHETYVSALGRLRSSLQGLARLQVIERKFLPNFLFDSADLVVAIGIDGLVANTAKYINGQPLIGVNPDPAAIDGLLLPFTVEQAPQIVRRALQASTRQQLKIRQVRMAQASLNDGQRLLAFNDLFIGVRSHVSSRYTLQFNGRQEQQSSSGIIVSTGAGSTGWLSSLFNLANGMWAAFGSQPSGPALNRPALDWEDDRLIFVVREPFASKTSQAGLVCGQLDPQTPLVITSQMPEGGVIFSDGVETDYLTFNAGTSATIGLAEQCANLVIG